MFHFILNTQLLIPPVLSLFAARNPSVLLIVLAVLSHFVVLWLTPCCRGRENIWMFVLVAISSIPLNLFCLRWLYEEDLLFGSFFVLGIFRIMLYYTVLLSIEEVIMGLFSRLIWQKQRIPIL